MPDRKFHIFVLFVLVAVFILSPITPGEAQESKYQEAPMLAELVAAGQLPPVDERLPDVPAVEEPINEIGSYGGTLQLIANEAISWGDPANIIRAHLIERDYRNPDEWIPGLAEAWELSEDGMVFTLRLREGLKWSDGEPFTTDDLLFMWEDVLMDPEVTPNGPPSIFTPGGVPMTVEKIDDLNIKYSFSVPYYTAPIYFSDWGDWYGTQQCCFQAKHILSKYHIKYNPDADQLAKDAGYEHWYELFSTKLLSNGVHDPEVPGMGPWVPTEEVTDGIIFERNPYYYRVDTEGNQLPYIDRIRATYRSSNDERVLAIIGGEVDVWINNQASLADYPIFKENEGKGGYTAYLLGTERPANVMVHVNLNYTPAEGQEDPFLAELLADARFRQALSLGIDRDAVNELVFLGTGEGVQLTVHRGASIYEEEWAQAYAQYDPEAANALLDEIGLTKDADGKRLRPDGKPLELVFEVPQQLAPNVQASELLKANWEALGLSINLKIQDVGLVVNHLDDASFQLTTFDSEWGGDFFVVVQGAAIWNSWSVVHQYWQWNASGGTSGIEPPDEWKYLFELDNERQLVPTATALENAKVLLQYQADNLPSIGVVGYAQSPAIVKNGLMNVDPTFHDIWEWNRIGGHRPDQWFWEQ